MNRLSTEKRAQIIGCLTEGMSIRGTCRITGAAKNTVTKLLVDLGDACSGYQHRTLVDLPCTTIECDEIWNFVYAKDKNIPGHARWTPARVALRSAHSHAAPRSRRRGDTCKHLHVPVTLPIGVEIAALRVLGALPARAKRLIAGPPLYRDGLELDLDTQMLLRLAQRRPAPPLSQRTVAQARADLLRDTATVAGSRIPLAEARETTVAGAEGPLRARMYVPEEAAGLAVAGPLVLYFHGGGWTCGDLDSHDQPCRALARSCGARVLSVDYRLAPEHRFPAPIEDALAAFRDVAARASELDVDPARIAVAGDSAGAHLAAVTAQQTVAAGGPVPAFQLLIYPVTDLVAVSESRKTFADGFVLTRQNMDWYEDQLLGELGDRRDPRASPLLADSLRGCPPAMVVTAGFDPLRDEGEAYAHALRAAGVSTILRRYPGYVHGFIHMFAVGRGADQAVGEIGGALRAALAR